jgi:Rod binding domain-containing protein
MNLDPNTSLALMQATQSDVASKANVAKQLSKSDEKMHEQLDVVAKDFESMFMTEMIKPMFEEINKPNEMFGGGKGEEIFNGFMMQEYGKLITETGGIGIADAVKQELIRMQETADNPRSAVGGAL